MSDFEQFRRERQRYREAKMAARRYKSVAHFDGSSGEDHPWIAAGRTTNGSELQPNEKEYWSGNYRRRSRSLAIAALVLLGAALLTRPYFKTSEDAAGAAASMPVTLDLWYDIAGGETAVLEEVLRVVSSPDLKINATYRPRIADALVHPRVPHPAVIITHYHDAMHLAAVGYLEPFISDDGEQYAIPLSPPIPWSRPLVAAIPFQDDESMSASARHVIAQLVTHIHQTRP